MSSLFITGAGGYLGRALLLRSGSRSGLRVVALVRRPVPEVPGVEFVRGDLLDPAGWRHLIPDGARVVHLAAVTGKAGATDYERVNVSGTRALIAASIDAGARGIVFVSSIAAGFSDRWKYHYAESKVRAEAVVRASGLPFSIVRPTIIAGPNSPVLEGLGKMAMAPRPVVFGDGRAPVQPIHVDDLADLLIDQAVSGEFTGETIPVGGPEILTIEHLLLRIRESGGAPPAPSVHLPVLPIRRLLGFLEGPLLPVLPLTAGQLATFLNDGTAGPAPREGMKGLDEMIRPTSGPDEPLPRLEDECRLLARYLTGKAPTGYVIEKYVKYHALAGAQTVPPMDRLLTAFARRGPCAVRIADTYCARMRKTSILRRKLVLVLGLLECSRPSFRFVDAPEAGSAGTVYTRLMVRGMSEVLAALAGMALFLPPDLLLRVAGRNG